MARYNLYKNGEFVNSIEAELMFTMAFCQSQGLTYEEVMISPEPESGPTQIDRMEAQVAYTAMMTDTLLESGE